MVGRKPKLAEMKDLAGNPGKRAVPKMPRFEPVDLPVPRGKLPKRARELWRKVAPVLFARGVLTEGDSAALELMCVHYALAWEALEVMSQDAVERFAVAMLAQSVDEEGDQIEVDKKVMGKGLKKAEQMRMLVVDERGLSRKHPLLQVWRENSNAFRMYAEQFGLTPSARGRIEYPDGEGGGGGGTLAEELFRLAAQMGTEGGES